MRLLLEGMPSAFSDLEPGTVFGIWRDKMVFGLTVNFEQTTTAALFTPHKQFGGWPWLASPLRETVIAFRQAVIRPDPKSFVMGSMNAPFGAVVTSPDSAALKVALPEAGTALFDVITGDEPGGDFKHSAHYTRWAVGFDRPTEFVTLFSQADVT
jgi:hypothetical protein